MPSKKKKFEPKAAPAYVEVTTGKLAGMRFEVEDHTPEINSMMKVKYRAPDNGPRAVVVHHKVKGEFREADKAEAVRIAFSQLIPASIRWEADRGYSVSTGPNAGDPVVWDRQLGRFVPVK